MLVEAAIKSVEQLNEINRINDELSDAYDSLEKAYLDMVETLRFTVEAKTHTLEVILIEFPHTQF